MPEFMHLWGQVAVLARPDRSLHQQLLASYVHARHEIPCQKTRLEKYLVTYPEEDSQPRTSLETKTGKHMVVCGREGATDQMADRAWATIILNHHCLYQVQHSP